MSTIAMTCLSTIARLTPMYALLASLATVSVITLIVPVFFSYRHFLDLSLKNCSCLITKVNLAEFNYS